MTTRPKPVNIFRAEGDAEDNPPVTIAIVQPMRDVPHDERYAFFASEGAALADAIWRACPGGTVDALIVALMQRRSSLLRVRFPEVVSHAR